MTRSSRVQSAGFTLVELMITVAIVGILAAISYSAYTQQMTKSRRATARALLLDVMQHEERWFTANNTYTATLTDMGYPATLETEANSHQISLAAGPSGAIVSSVAVTATALVADAGCLTLVLDSTNRKTATGSTPTACW